MRFYKRDPDAALAGMAGLTLQERGAYNTIIDLLYSRDGLLADDDDAMRCALGCHGHEWRSVKSKLLAKGKIWIADGYVKAKRVDDVLEEAAKFSETQGKRAAKRWQTEPKSPLKGDQTSFKSNSKSEYNQRKQRQNSASPGMPLTSTPTPIDRKKDISLELPLADGSGFAGWYTAYPKHVGRGQAEKAYRRALSKTTPANLLAGAQSYAAERKGQDPAYTKHPATWLNGECWGDEPPETPETAQAQMERRAREVFKEPKRAIANLLLTFPDDPYRALEKIEEAAAQKNPDGSLNGWLWKHGPAGVEVGAMD